MASYGGGASEYGDWTLGERDRGGSGGRELGPAWASLEVLFIVAECNMSIMLLPRSARTGHLLRSLHVLEAADASEQDATAKFKKRRDVSPHELNGENGRAFGAARAHVWLCSLSTAPHFVPLPKRLIGPELATVI